MSWIKQANRKGRYKQSYRGFRIYETKPGSMSTHIEHRPDGDYRVTAFTPSEFLAIDKTGCVFEGTGIEKIGYDIDIELLQRSFDKKEK